MTDAGVDETGLPNFEALVPLFDRLAELAERELPGPISIEIRGWDDGDFTAVAYHSHGTDPDSGISARQVIKYVREKEAFVYRFIEQDGDDTSVLSERVVEVFPAT